MIENRYNYNVAADYTFFWRTYFCSTYLTVNEMFRYGPCNDIKQLRYYWKYCAYFIRCKTFRFSRQSRLRQLSKCDARYIFSSTTNFQPFVFLCSVKKCRYPTFQMHEKIISIVNKWFAESYIVTEIHPLTHSAMYVEGMSMRGEI